ncbi:MAG: hypothetical protein RIT28_461 [Pseudomonadota bacterium]
MSPTSLRLALTVAALAPSLVACADRRAGDDSVAALSDECGDVDGDGGDTGNVPNILGSWTATMGAKQFEESCGLAGLSKGSDTPVHGAMEIKGRVPDQLYLVFDEDSGERFFGLVAPTGGATFSGVHESAEGNMHIAVGGLTYDDIYRDRTYIEGHAFIGVDLDLDGNIDCSAKGEWTAAKSGA